MSDGEKTVIGYMCGIDWQHELGEALGGTKVYASADDPELAKHGSRKYGCGVVEVEVRIRRWVVPQDLENASGWIVNEDGSMQRVERIGDLTQ